MYEKQAIIPYRTTGAMEVTESKKLLDIIKRIDWTSQMSAYALAGWLLLAPWGGEGCSGGGHMYGLSGLMVLVNHG